LDVPQPELLLWPAILHPRYFISICGLPTIFNHAALPNNLQTNSQPVNQRTTSSKRRTPTIQAASIDSWYHRQKLTDTPQRAYKFEGVAKAACQPANLVRLFFSFVSFIDYHSPDCSDCWFNRLKAQTLFEHRDIFFLLQCLRLLLWLLMTLVQVMGCCLSTGQLLCCLPIF